MQLALPALSFEETQELIVACRMRLDEVRTTKLASIAVEVKGTAEALGEPLQGLLNEVRDIVRGA